MGLREILLDLNHKAIKSPPLPFRITLSGGLRIDVRIVTTERGTETRLQISRPDVYPSVEEWSTVLRLWPDPIDYVTPREVKHEGRFYLIGSWPTPAPRPLQSRLIPETSPP